MLFDFALYPAVDTVTRLLGIGGGTLFLLVARWGLPVVVGALIASGR